MNYLPKSFFRVNNTENLNICDHAADPHKHSPQSFILRHPVLFLYTTEKLPRESTEENKEAVTAEATLVLHFHRTNYCGTFISYLVSEIDVINEVI